MLEQQKNGIRQACQSFLKGMDKQKTYKYGNLEIKWDGQKWVAQRDAEDYLFAVASKMGQYDMISDNPEANARQVANFQLLLWIAEQKAKEKSTLSDG